MYNGAGYGDTGSVVRDGPSFESRSKSDLRREDITEDTGWRRTELGPGIEPPETTNDPDEWDAGAVGSGLK